MPNNLAGQSMEIKQLQQTQRIRACLFTNMYLATCISHPNCCPPPRLSCLYGLGSIPTIGTCAQRAAGPTAAQCYTSIVVLQSCISLFKPTCIGNISQSGVVVRFRPRAFLLWFCHHFCFIHVTFCATLMWCKLIEFGILLGFNIFAFPPASCLSLSPFFNCALPQRFRNCTHGKRRAICLSLNPLPLNPSSLSDPDIDIRAAGKRARS